MFHGSDILACSVSALRSESMNPFSAMRDEPLSPRNGASQVKYGGHGLQTYRQCLAIYYIE